VCSLNTVCNDTNCQDCTGNITTCLICKTGFRLSNSTCIRDICNIANC
jgi:hypothetical protein